MSRTLHPTDYPGVRYREHPTRRRGPKPDRYFFIRHTYAGKTYEEGLGWASQGFSAVQANGILSELRQNQKLGRGPVTLAQMRAEADKARAEAEETAKSAQAIPATFDKLADAYMIWAKKNKIDHASDERRLRLHILPVLGVLTLGKIRHHDIETLKDGLIEKKLAPATVKHCIVLVRMVFNRGREIYGLPFADLVGENPTTGIKLAKLRNGRLRYLKKKESDKLLQYALEHDPMLHNIILLCLYTGLRRSEIERMQALDVDIDGRVLHVRDAKGGANETVDIQEFLVPMMETLTDDLKPSDLVFASWRTGGQLKSISRRFKDIVDGLGLNEGIEDKRHFVVFHTLRHTFISWLVLQGEDMHTVQMMARHRSYEMTLRYSHLAPGGKRRAANRLERPGSTDGHAPAKTRRHS